jgi:hypothetical protein
MVLAGLEKLFSRLKGLFFAPTVPVFWISWSPVNSLIDTIADYKNLEWVKIGRVESVAALVDDPSRVCISCVHTPSDKGQKILSDSEKTCERMAFRVDLPGHETNYFRGITMRQRRVDIGRRSFEIGIDSVIIIQGE